MSYGKDDFLDWDDDIDLDSLLGEYTCSEIELTDDDEPSKKKQKTKNAKSENMSENVSAKAKTYRCSECQNSYASISGLRGHLRNKHGITNVKASNYREKNPTDLQTKPQKFTLNDDDFDKTFNETLAVTLQNIVNSQFRNMKKSVHGKAIIGIANQLRENIPVKQQVEGLLKPVFKSIFSAAADDGQNNETLFGIFYEKAHDPEVNMKLKDLLSDIGDGGKLVRPFLGVMLHQLMSDLIGKQASMFRRAVEKTDTNVSEYDQTVLYYVSGYITSALFKQARQVGKRDSVKQELLKESLGHFLKKESDSEKTFVEKYSKWTEKVDRGGLKVPSDDFFLFIRECEMACRESVDQKHLHSGTYNTVTLKEKIMERYMVKHYIEKLAKGKLASFVIEKCISLFLTVRGHAAAKRKRQELLKSVPADEKKAVRKVLKEKSANAPAKK